MIIRKHATRQDNLLDIAKTSSWSIISKVPKLFEQNTYIIKVEYWQMNIVRGMEKAVNLPSPNN
jgi:hypothetical protein